MDPCLCQLCPRGLHDEGGGVVFRGPIVVHGLARADRPIRDDRDVALAVLDGPECVMEPRARERIGLATGP